LYIKGKMLNFIWCQIYTFECILIGQDVHMRCYFKSSNTRCHFISCADILSNPRAHSNNS
jgi:hypothetical protein